MNAMKLNEQYIQYLNSKIRLNTKRPIFKYANLIKTEISINSVEQLYTILKDELGQSNPKEKILNYKNFIEWLEVEKIDYDENIENLCTYIKIDILSEVASALWGKNSNYKIKSIIDNQILQTIEYLNNK